jgi:hypothetical protein
MMAMARSFSMAYFNSSVPLSWGNCPIGMDDISSFNIGSARLETILRRSTASYGSSSASGAPTISRQRFLTNADSPDSLDDEIELLRPYMLVQRIGASRREPPQAGAKNLAPAPLEEVRIRNLHEIRRPPGKVIGLDQEISVNRFHLRGGVVMDHRYSLLFRGAHLSLIRNPPGND